MGERGGSDASDPAAVATAAAAASAARAAGSPELYRLMAWLSPSYPVGAFSYSSGLEWAVEAGDVRSAADLRRWVAALLAQGSALVDGVLFAHAHRLATEPAQCAAPAMRALAELAAALPASQERYLETTAQGRAFLAVTRAAWPCRALDRLADLENDAVAYPVAVGVAAAGHGIPVEPALTAFLHALAANLISAGMRLVPLGQTDGARALAACEDAVADACGRALACPLDEIGSACFRADIASMRHETQYTRLFRT